MANPEVATEMVRARSDKGHYIADDPKTEINEAWVEKPKKENSFQKRKPQKKANKESVSRFSKIARPQKFRGVL